MRYLIEHLTELKFSEPVREHHCELRLKPFENEFQRVHSFQLLIQPEAFVYEYSDAFGNRVHAFDVTGPHTSLLTSLRLEVETRLENPFDFFPPTPAEEREILKNKLKLFPPLYNFLLHRSPSTPALEALKGSLKIPDYDGTRPLLENMQTGMEWVQSLLRYVTGATEVHTPLEEALSAKAGVCQDFSHLLISLVRHWGFPARYVMGYQDPGAWEETQDPATHAWAEVWLPGAGWRGFDATHRLLVNDLYVPVAVGRDYQDAAPQRGSFKGPVAGEPPAVQLRMNRQQ